MVVVALVPVALTKVKFCRVEEPVARRLERVARPDELITLANKLVEKKLVEVALDEVEFIAVKFWKVEEELASKLAKVPNPVEVKLPPVPVVKKRLVVEAVVEKRLVVVALELVELTAVKFCRVVEPETRRSPLELMVVVAVPPIRSWLPVICPPKREVEVALVVVERVMLLKMWAPVQVGEKVWSTVTVLVTRERPVEKVKGFS